MALDTFNPYLFVSSGEQSNKFLTPTYADGIAQFQAQRAQSLTGLTVRINAIQEGTGDPSPSNIRPISGRTGMTVTRAGKNLLKFPYVTGSTTASGITITINSDGTVTVNGTADSTIGSGVAVVFSRSLAADLNLKPGDVLYFSAGQTYNADSAYCRLLYNDNNAGIGRITEENKPITITDSMILREINFQIWIPNGVTVNDMTFKPIVSLSPTEWQSPTINQTYPISWQTEAGTIYGGTLDVASGVLTVNRFFKAFDGTENWARTGSTGANTNRYYIQWVNIGITGDVINLSNTICSHLVFLSGNVGQFGTFNASTTNFAVKDGDGTQFADMAAFKAWLAAQNTNGTPLQLCVELATPTTYQIAPADIMTLAGFNQIYSDAGPVIDIKF